MSSGSKKGRLKTLKRATSKQLPAMRMTKRDHEIIKAVYEYRALITPQIETLLFLPDTPGKKTRCVPRLQKLYHHGYLWRDALPTKPTEGNRPLIYRIDEKSLSLLPDLLNVEPEEIEWSKREHNVTSPFLGHLLRTNDVRVAVEVACQKQGLEIVRWLDDQTLKSHHAKEYVTVEGPRGGKQDAAFIPDGYFHLQMFDGERTRNAHHFLEVDMGTMVGQATAWGKATWVKKIRTYLAYANSGKFTARYQAKSFRMLTATTTDRRLTTLKTITEKAGGKYRFWFTTFDKLNYQTVLTEPIWYIAGREGSHTLIK